MVKARWLLVALLSVPLIDAIALVFVAGGTRWFGGIGWPATILLVVLTALIGTLLVRAEGRRTLRKIQRSLARGDPPTNELIDGGFLIAAGALLLTPGLVTDAIGFVFVLPPTRVPIRMALKKYVIVPYMDKQTDGFATGQVYTFGFPDEGERREVDPSDFDLGGPAGNDADGPMGRPGGFGGVDPSVDSDGSDDTVDLGRDEYDVESGDVDVEDHDPDTGDR